MTDIMKYPAPRRCDAPSGHGKYTTHPWSILAVAQALSIGAWFQIGRHDFADKDARTLAFGGEDEYEIQ